MAMIGEVQMISCGPGKLGHGFGIYDDEDVCRLWCAYDTLEEAQEVRRDMQRLIASAIMVAKSGQ